MLRLSVDGLPQPGGSKSAYRHKHTGKIVVVDANKNVKGWKEAVQWQVKEQLPERFQLFDCPLIVGCTFFMPRPKGHFTKKGKLSATGKRRPKPDVKPDVLKLMRSTEDALTGVVWTDDARITGQHLEKLYVSGNDRAGVEIVVAPALEYNMVMSFTYIDPADRRHEE